MREKWKRAGQAREDARRQAAPGRQQTEQRIEARARAGSNEQTTGEAAQGGEHRGKENGQHGQGQRQGPQQRGRRRGWRCEGGKRGQQKRGGKTGQHERRPHERGGEQEDAARKLTRAEQNENENTRERLRKHTRRASGRVTETSE